MSHLGFNVSLLVSLTSVGDFLYLWLYLKFKPMKKLLFLLPLLAIISCADPDNPNGAIFNNRGCLECDNYIAGETFIINGITYQVADREMLETAISYGDNLTIYCTSKIKKMNTLFFSDETFNQDISSWDVSNVINMDSMFYGASDFNQSIGNWDVSNVMTMNNLFANARNFNQNIGNWDVSKVNDMAGLFAHADYFNQDIGNWDVGNVSDMGAMFFSANDFNRNIGSWNVSEVTNMSWMFSEAGFNRDLTKWCVSNFSSMPDGFATNSSFSSSNHPVWGTCP